MSRKKIDDIEFCETAGKDYSDRVFEPEDVSADEPEDDEFEDEDRYLSPAKKQLKTALDVIEHSDQRDALYTAITRYVDASVEEMRSDLVDKIDGRGVYDPDY